VLARQTPHHLESSPAGFAVRVRGRQSYLIPDVVVMDRLAFQSGGDLLRAQDVLLAVEVLSPGNSRNDLVTKRAEYADGGIPHYWIVDPEEQTLTVLTLDDGGEDYIESAVVRPGQAWKTEEPFPFTLDLGEIF
jgi:Uma2 family endonuclease